MMKNVLLKSRILYNSVSEYDIKIVDVAEYDIFMAGYLIVYYQNMTL